MSDWPNIRRVPPPPPDPRNVRFASQLEAAPLDSPKRRAVDETAARRASADHLCLWLGCARVLCRQARRCVGRSALCVFEQEEVKRPILEEVVQAGFGPR